MTTTASLLGPLCAVIVGAVLAVAVAVGFSPLSPIGPVRAVYPNGGFAFDWPVLGVGFALLFLVLSAISIGLVPTNSKNPGPRSLPLRALGSRAARIAADIGLPVTAVVGLRFALERPSERDAAPVRSASWARSSRS